MWKRSLLALACLGGSATAFAAGLPEDKPVETLSRTGAWVVDYNETGCHLYAEFGAGADKVTARFTRDQPGEAFDFALFGARFRDVRSFSRGQLDFGLGPASDHRILAVRADKLSGLLFATTLLAGKQVAGDSRPGITPEEEARVTGVTFALAGKPQLRLEFGSLAKPMAQMRHCTQALVASWGYDAAEQATRQRGVWPATSPSSWVSDSDYPTEQMRRNTSGIVRFRLGIAADGSVESCTVLAQTEPSEFGTRTCNLIRRRARLQPAIDASGKPIRSYFVSTASWLMP